jgi:hypothetical protein
VEFIVFVVLILVLVLVVKVARAAKNDQTARVVEDGVEPATALLAGARGGAAVVAFRNLVKTVKKQHGRHEGQAVLTSALESIDFDPSRLESPQLGELLARTGPKVEVHRDWVIRGQEAHDVDATTWAKVVCSGRQLKDRDNRKAELQIVSSSWAMRVPIFPDRANEARFVADQLNAMTRSRSPRAATSADIKALGADMEAMVEKLVMASGPSPAEKISQLSDLRYGRLISDDEYESAKVRILGI